MTGTLYIQRTRGGRVIAKPRGLAGSLAVVDGSAFLFDGLCVLAQLKRVSLSRVNPEGLFVEGLEEPTPGRLLWQEWYFVPELA